MAIGYIHRISVLLLNRMAKRALIAISNATVLWKEVSPAVGALD
jgi:hypothetical protein